MSYRVRATLLALALGACGGDSSTSVVVAVDNSVDDEESDPNLIVVIRHDDDDDEDEGAAALTGALEATARARRDSRAAEPDLAYVASPGSVALVSEHGEKLAEVGMGMADGVKNGTRLVPGSRDPVPRLRRRSPRLAARG
jgi:hypothetical protein